MEIAVGFFNDNHPNSKRQPTIFPALLSARKVSVAEGNRAQYPLVMDTILSVPSGGICSNVTDGLNCTAAEALTLNPLRWKIW